MATDWAILNALNMPLIQPTWIIEVVKAFPLTMIVTIFSAERRTMAATMKEKESTHVNVWVMSVYILSNL